MHFRPLGTAFLSMFLLIAGLLPALPAPAMLAAEETAPAPAASAAAETAAEEAAPAAEAGPVAGETEKEGQAGRVETFLRIIRNDEGEPTELQTAVARYVPATGDEKLVVELIAAVHLGEKAYYDELNKLFEGYEVVLYELVAPKGTRVPKGGRKPDNPISMLQSMTKSYLGLELQTDLIDYTKENFVHADMTPKEMQEAMKERGDDGFTIFLSATAEMMRQQNLRDEERRRELEENPEAGKDDPAEEIDLFTLLLDPQGALRVKRLMAEQFITAGTSEEAIGATLDQLLVKDRNAAAIKVFAAEKEGGKKKIAIFYGAMHMPDFEDRLTSEYGLKREGERWITAWDLTGKNAKAESGLERLLRALDQ